ncbi:methyl-accepting chemotaxis protein [Derxia gummosa]|uniref:Methyl-accepting chemotaxis protein n=1 Tax=Derxia gummosa DSM 723 TaxID=1121388 RepID=A0A8B6XCR6_9BURK|nr:methyl-accepting chemotaxis protein [Derxia gummosa]
MAFRFPELRLPAGLAGRLARPEAAPGSLGGTDGLPGTRGGADTRWMIGALAAAAVVGTATLAYDFSVANRLSRQIDVVGSLLMHTQRMARVANDAVSGSQVAYDIFRDAHGTVQRSLAELRNSTSGDALASYEKLAKLWEPSDVAATRLAEAESLIGLQASVHDATLNAERDLLNLVDRQVAKARSHGPGARDYLPSFQLAIASTEVSRTIGMLMRGDFAEIDADPASIGKLDGQLNAMSDAIDALDRSGDDPDTKATVARLRTIVTGFRTSLSGLMSPEQDKRIQEVHQMAVHIEASSEAVKDALLELRSAYLSEDSSRKVDFLIILVSGALVVGLGIALGKTFIDDSQRRAVEAESRREQAERQEQEMKRVNDQNQAAILRLMNELQEVADGDLTVQATVSEDITGAIADSVNYTVEELRNLVGRINNAAEQVANASSQAAQRSQALLTASESQSREIRETGESVLLMAQQIQEVSSSAAESAEVARQSLKAAADGRLAVQNAISGMNEIREQIQETSKRIKRLGESSQEIGEIVELITDITEQTNVLALNAAIQAASAGEAGRGFSVVAEEVQRLAERSGEAAKQIAALIRTIQTDTQDAVAAMEKSTAGVVEGARLSDDAGRSLEGIGEVSRTLAELIERISTTTSEQAGSAGSVARSIERILAVTEQTSLGTEQTARSIRELAALAKELKNSVARFRVA